MKWKDDVQLEQAEGYWLVRGEKKKRIAEEDIRIAGLIDRGITDDGELLECVAKEPEENAVSAGLRLAQFVESYVDYLAEGKKSRVFF